MIYRMLMVFVLSFFLSVSSAAAEIGGKEAKIQRDLDSFVTSYILKSNNRMSVNKRHPKIFKRDGKFVATYTEIDPKSASVQMKKSSSRHFDYVAKLRYEELTYESVADTLKSAVKGTFRCVKVRKLVELPRYAKGRWEN